MCVHFAMPERRVYALDQLCHPEKKRGVYPRRGDRHQEVTVPCQRTKQNVQKVFVKINCFVS